MTVYFRPYRSTLSAGAIPGEMIPGRVDPSYFRLLMSVSFQRSIPMVQALEGVLVRGMARKEVCELYGVTAGNLSVKLSRLQIVSQTIAQMYPCQFNRADCPVSWQALMQEADCTNGSCQGNNKASY
ncbi:adhesin biosynthesis transcription regulatory family protein [Citrobacter arsenatis]|jgi:Adhesin biosynthesis transcription regulatory protein.|nr:adhesin biosynthesis transcription regulatory family protein [Citrobacter arsenatis]